MGDFRRLSEGELARLPEGELIEYAIEARLEGERESASLALSIFAFGMEDAVRAFVRARLGSHGDTAIEEVAERALEDAIRSIDTLSGLTPQEARGFVFTIARRRIADHLRRGRPGTDSLDGGGEAERGALPDGLRVAGDAAAVETTLVVRELVAELRGAHREVVELNVLSGYSARETVDLIDRRNGGRSDDSMTEPNVHQIASRFRKLLRARLEAGAGGVWG